MQIWYIPHIPDISRAFAYFDARIPAGIPAFGKLLRRMFFLRPRVHCTSKTVVVFSTVFLKLSLLKWDSHLPIFHLNGFDCTSAPLCSSTSKKKKILYPPLIQFSRPPLRSDSQLLFPLLGIALRFFSLLRKLHHRQSTYVQEGDERGN